jgi:carbamoyltransferase
LIFSLKNKNKNFKKLYTIQMIILGINAHHADSSAAIFVNGVMIAATEEERFTRIKHWAGFPSRSVAFCLQEAGVTLDQVDHIAIGRDPKAKLGKKLAFFAKNPLHSANFVKDRLTNSKKVTGIETELATLSGLSEEVIKTKIRQVEHHRSHLASAFFASPFDEAALLSIDGSGDFTTTMIGVGKGKHMEVLDSIDFPHSMGIFYTAFTQLLGFPYYGDEYKVMGLAPYGEPKYVDKLRKVVLWKDDGLFELDLSYFRSATKGFVSYENNVPIIPPLFGAKMEAEFGAARTKEEPLGQYHKDMAASVQRFTEETIFHILKGLHKRTGLTRVCIAGGVAQNSVANGKITRNTPFTEVYIPSAGHDAGISMGAALFAQHEIAGMERQPAIWTAYTGSRFDNDTIEKLLKEKDIKYRKLDNEELYETVAERLVNGGVIGWFSGRAEFGPRALGWQVYSRRSAP